MDILQKLEKLFLEDADFIYVSKDKILNIFGYLVEDTDDSILLGTIKQQIKEHWGLHNKKLIEDVHDILGYYGIIERKNVQKKMIVEKKGKFFIKNFIVLKHINEIKELLKD